MSQTETLLLFILGFALASLIALFAGRMMWAAALRVGARRMQRQLPSSLVELQTERARLRAENAMLVQRLGAKLENARLQVVEQMAEVNRHRNRIQAMHTHDAARIDEVRRLKSQLAQLERALSESRAVESDLRRSLAERDEALRKFDKKQRKPKAEAPVTEPTPPPPPPDDSELRLRQRIEKLSELARHQRPEAPRAAEDLLMAERLSTAEQQTAGLERELEALDTQWPKEPDGTSPPQPSERDTQTAETDANVISIRNRLRDVKKTLGSG